MKKLGAMFAGLVILGVSLVSNAEAQESGIIYGHLPAAGGHGTFVYAGGTHEDLINLVNCTNPVFWFNSPEGHFVPWIPTANVEMVNAEFLAIFPVGEEIPRGTIFIARCAA